MKKRLLFILSLVLVIFSLTGCEEEESTMIAYTSVYPAEYILDTLYGNKIAIYSIYPDGTNFMSYDLTSKQISDYGNGDLFVYNGTILKERDYAVQMINNNSKIKIIDASQGMDYTYDLVETWLDPSNYMMMASNIEKGLEEYIEEKVDLKDIKSNYESLKLSLSEIDAELKNVGSKAKNPTLLVADDSFKFLEKYGFNVISLENTDNLTDKVLSDARKIASNKEVSYIFLKDDQEQTDLVKEFISSYSLTVVNFNSLSTLSASNRKDKKDYVTIMNDNINSIKLEVNN